MKENSLFAPWVGHPAIQQKILQSYRQDRLPHAFLFYGPEGCGKEAMAISVAQMLNCESGDGLACGECPQCQKIMHLRHPDVKFVFPTPAQSNIDAEEMATVLQEKAANFFKRVAFPGKNVFISIDSIRDLKSEARFSLYEGRKKVYILSEADAMRPEAANALLKLLEEPPPNLMLILTTSNIHKILPTIKSRCQLVRFPPYSESEMLQIARQYLPAELQNELPLLIRLSGYNLKRLFDLLEMDYEKIRSLVLEFLRKVVLIQRAHELLEIIEMLTSGRDRQQMKLFLWFLLLWFQDILQLRQGNPSPDYIMNQDWLENLQKFVDFLPELDIHRCVELIERAMQELDDPRNFNPVLILTGLAIKLHQEFNKSRG